mgnify:CR=1 FL=1
MKKYKIILVLIGFLISSDIITAQSLSGMSGLFSIPTADMNQTNSVWFGANFLNKKYLDYDGGDKDVFNAFINVNYLPFLEMGFRVTRRMDTAVKEGHTVDRMANFRIRFIEESNNLPAIAIGANNPISTLEAANHFNSLYIVTTKNFTFDSPVNNIQTTIGYGSDIIKASDYEFIGVFGGVSASFFNFAELLLEYDAEHFNGGIRLSLLNNHIKLLAGYQNFTAFNGGIALSFIL